LTHFFLYPVGHFGFTDMTFLLNLPLTQVIVVFFAIKTGAVEALGFGVGSIFVTS
jgi:hypothetical protein